MKIKTLLFSTLFSLTLFATENPCKGKTKSGTPCRAVIVNKAGYCNAHNPDRPHCTAKNTKGEACGMAPAKGQTLCRMHSPKN